MKYISSMFLISALVVGCGSDDGVDSDAEAEAAYLGLDGAIRAAITMGFDGFNEASSANIPTQTASGIVTGTITVDGQVDQGASDNKGMRLSVELVDYRDIPDDVVDAFVVTYDTDAAALPEFDVQLRGLPDADMEATLRGSFFMAGEIEGEVVLDLVITGMTQADPLDASRIQRVPGTTTVVGTATSAYGVYDVDLVL